MHTKILFFLGGVFLVYYILGTNILISKQSCFCTSDKDIQKLNKYWDKKRNEGIILNPPLCLRNCNIMDIKNVNSEPWLSDKISNTTFWLIDIPFWPFKFNEYK